MGPLCHFFRRVWTLGLTHLSQSLKVPSLPELSSARCVYELPQVWTRSLLCLLLIAVTRALPDPKCSGQLEQGKGEKWSGFCAYVHSTAFSWEILNCVGRPVMESCVARCPKSKASKCHFWGWHSQVGWRSCCNGQDMARVTTEQESGLEATFESADEMWPQDS